MKSKRWMSVVFGLFLLLSVGTMGWVIANSAPQAKSMDEMMKMMKEKMMNRPGAMKKADKSIEEQKAKAMKSGSYSCCLKNPCDHCALKMGECPCGMNAANDMPVCNECKGGWYAGNGNVPGKTADQIKTLPRGAM